MWKAIYIVANQAQADKLCGALTAEGFLARAKAVSCEEDTAIEIQVPEAEAEDAQSVIANMGAEF